MKENWMERHAVRTGSKVNASYSVRTAIEKILFDLANQHANEAQAACNTGLHNDELIPSLQAVILATACLEAFINQKGIENLGEKFHEYDQGKIDVQGNVLNSRHFPTVEDKWCDLTELIGKKQFKKGKSPFQGFRKLLILRNYILHYKEMPSHGVAAPWPDMEGVVTKERALFTARTAQDGVKSTEGMLREFHTLTSMQLPEWLK
jgi:hypothetical protein